MDPYVDVPFAQLTEGKWAKMKILRKYDLLTLLTVPLLLFDAFYIFGFFAKAKTVTPFFAISHLFAKMQVNEFSTSSKKASKCSKYYCFGSLVAIMFLFQKMPEPSQSRKV